MFDVMYMHVCCVIVVIAVCAEDNHIAVAGFTLVWGHILTLTGQMGNLSTFSDVYFEINYASSSFFTV